LHSVKKGLSVEIWGQKSGTPFTSKRMHYILRRERNGQGVGAMRWLIPTETLFGGVVLRRRTSSAKGGREGGAGDYEGKITLWGVQSKSGWGVDTGR